MVDTDKLRGCLVENRITQTEMSEKLGMTPKTFISRMKQKKFMTDEIDIMVDVLGLNTQEAVAIFFAKKVT